jgi:predicted membrane chloride channel (bestrophin family)
MGLLAASISMVGSLFRVQGSVWNSAWPFVLWNTLLAVLIHLISAGCFGYFGTVHLGISEIGHKYCGPLVSFFIVTRVSQSYSRFLTGRQELGNALQQCGEIVTLSIALTRNHNTAAVHRWRKNVADHIALFVSGLITLTHSDKGRLDRDLSDAQREKLDMLVDWVATEHKSDADSLMLLERRIYGLTLLLRRSIMEEKAYLGEANSIGTSGVPPTPLCTFGAA